MSQVKNAGPVPPPALHKDRLRLFFVEMNPYCHRVLLILEAKKVKYELYKLDPLKVPAWFRSKNPRLKIPVLEVPTSDGDRYLYESVVICDYLDEQYTKNQLHATEPFQKAQDRLLIERFNELIKGSLECFDTNFTFGGDQIISTLALLDRELNHRGTNYFNGDSRPGMLDYMIWPWLERLCLLRCVDKQRFDEKKYEFTNMAAWAGRMQLDEAVKKHAHQPQEYYDYYKSARIHPTGLYL